jgi:hypothetical protein
VRGVASIYRRAMRWRLLGSLSTLVIKLQAFLSLFKRGGIPSSQSTRRPAPSNTKPLPDAHDVAARRCGPKAKT